MLTSKKFIPGIAWFFLVLVLLCLPGSEFPKAKIPFLELIFFDKWVHFGLFCILAFLWMMPFAKSDMDVQSKMQMITKIFLATCVWGLATEFIQKYYIPFRSYDLWDWAADSAGAFVAWFYWRRKIQQEKVNP
jgi:VanZ family protein